MGGIVKSFDSKSKKSDDCSRYMPGKQTKKTYCTNNHRSKHGESVIYSDVCGPIPVESCSKEMYIFTFVDDYFGYVVVEPIVRKSQALEKFKLF